MHLIVDRFHFTDFSSVGHLTIDDDPFKCFSLEDTDRKLETYSVTDMLKYKVENRTAIPRSSCMQSGTYPVGMRMSPHLGQMVPWIMHVPNYKWVYLHWGNKPADTDGCILVGETFDASMPDWIGYSRAIFNVLCKKVEDAINGGIDVSITVK